MREKRMGHTLGRRTGTVLLTLCMLLGMVSALAAEIEPTELSLDNGDVSISSAGIYKITQTDGNTPTADTITVTADGGVTLILDGINIAASDKAAIWADCPSLTLYVKKTSRLSAESAHQDVNTKTGALANTTGALAISAAEGAELYVSATDKTSDIRPVRGIYFKETFENSAELTVSAESKSLGPASSETYAIHGWECGTFTNRGTINLTAHTTNGPAYGICFDGAKNLVLTNENAGIINANATALGGKDVDGYLGAGNSNFASGITVIETSDTPSSIVNEGAINITATNPGENAGALEYAVGIQMDCNGTATLINRGTITAVATEADSSAINLQTYGPTAKLVNSGTLDLAATTQGRTKTINGLGDIPCFAVGIQLVTVYGTEYPQLVLEEGSDVRIATALSANAVINDDTAKTEERLMAVGVQRAYGDPLAPRPEQIVLDDSIQIVSPTGGTFVQKDDDDVLLDTLVDSEENIACEATLKTAVAYTIALNAAGGEVDPASLQTSMGGKLENLPIPTNSSSYRFLGWFTSESGGDAVTTDTIFNSNTTIYAHWEHITPPAGSIEGSVTNNTGVQCDITVTIEEGNAVQATHVLSNVTSSTRRNFSFSALPDGFYNVVADSGVYKVTRLVEIKDGATVVNVTLTLGKTQSVVEIVTPDTPPAAVNGLPEQFEETVTEANKGYTTADETVVTSGGTVELKLAVERKEETSVSADAALIAGAAAGQTIPMYLDLSVFKTVIPTSGVATETKLVSVPKLLIVVLPLPDEAVGKQNITVYRVHSGAAEALPKTDPGRNGEWAEISGENAILHIRQFSTYAVAYDTPSSGDSVTAYTITATAGEGGSISPSGKVRVNHGGKKAFTITPDEGYEIADVLVDGKSAGAVSGYVFESVKAGHTITASFQKADGRAVWNPFDDVHEDDWFHDEVKYAYENGLMRGTSDTTFSPYLDTSRGMIVTILWRMEGGPEGGTPNPYPDVTPGTYYYEAVAWGDKHDIVLGYDTGLFAPNDPVTREQLAAILWRYAKDKGIDVSVGENTNILSYADFAQISEYAIPAIQWAAGAGIISGKDGGRLDPKGTATRAETATMLERFLKYIK